MADGTTTNYTFVKPEVGASEDTWGAKLNANWDAIDTLLGVTTLGTSQASKFVTTDANGVTTFDGGIVEDETAVTSTTNATTINCQDGNVFTHVLTENTTFTFSNPPASGRSFGFTLKLVQDSTARTITWPASVDWANGEAPTISAGSGEVDVFVFYTHDGGTNWYGFVAGQAMGTPV
jgi:hypothetical protein